MFRVVLGAGFCAQLLERRADSRRLIDRQLLLDRKMQRQVQKRVHCAVLGRIVAVEIALWIVEQRVVLGVQQDDLQRDSLQSAQRLAGAVALHGAAQHRVGPAAVVGPLRAVKDDEEVAGLDVSQHGERAYVIEESGSVPLLSVESEPRPVPASSTTA